MKRCTVLTVLAALLVSLCGCQSDRTAMTAERTAQDLGNPAYVKTAPETGSTEPPAETTLPTEMPHASETMATEAAPYFAPYTIRVQRDALDVYDAAGYTVGNWIYTITDRRTITITAELTFEEHGSSRTWGRLDTGGWVCLMEACYVESVSIPETEAEVPEIIEPEPEPETEAPEPVETEPAELGGVLIDQYIYGCGNKHTATANGITFVWYDRYEKRNYNNTEVVAYLDINSLSVRYEADENKWGGGEWIVDYDFYVSEHIVGFWWKQYDREGYYLDDVSIANITYQEYQGKCRGTWYKDHRFMHDDDDISMLCPAF